MVDTDHDESVVLTLNLVSYSTAYPPPSRTPLCCVYAQQSRAYATAAEKYRKPVLSENALLRETAPISTAEDDAASQRAGEKAGASGNPKSVPMDRDPDIMAAKLDPKPTRRKQWERKMVIKSVRRRGRLSKEEVIKRTERSAMYISDQWKTSMKKLAPLARQIAGKTLGEAIVQMDFSKKKNSLYIRDFLEKARLVAQIERGMGLNEGSDVKKNREAAERLAAGLPPLEPEAEVAKAGRELPEVLATGADTPESVIDEEQLEAQEKARQEASGEEEDKEELAAMKNQPKHDLGRRITLKDGTPYTVYDNTTMYIAQAWVNKGSYGSDVMKRARGRLDRLRLPQTSR